MGTDIVVGSGPSGLAAAAALLQRGRTVVMLDVGISLERAAAALRDRLGAVEPDAWTEGDRALLGASRRSEHSDSMRLFGSDFLFQVPAGEGEPWDDHARVHDLRPSFARGGLSNGWGAACLPYRDEDIADWPIGATELAPHYRAMAELARVTGRRDDLATLFPVLPIERERSLPLSRQAEMLLARLAAKRPALRRHGVYFGEARQAVAPDCRRCGQCLHGCPYGLIFNSGSALSQLLTNARLTYRPGVLVRSFAEEAGGVVLRTDDATIEGERLFLACGVLPTASLVLRSLDAGGHETILKDSRHFYLPMLHRWSAGDPAIEPRHNLAQLFWEIADPAVDPHTVHVQIYTHNDAYAPDMRRRFGRIAGPLEPLIGALSRRLIVAQGFLHSDVSPAIGLRLGAEGRLDARAVDNPRAAAATRRASNAVARIGRAAGMLALTPLLRHGTLGSSFHCGGSFPMRQQPRHLETDIWGRPAGLERVHIVDASVFPSIPATTITLSVMANAHRIAAGFQS